VGGGPERSVSLRELTALCAERAGARLEPGSDPHTHPADVPWFVTDTRDVTARTGWAPRRSLADTLDDVFRWLEAERSRLESLLRAGPRS
jgi:CDP-paratose 2-epimerase